MRSSRGSPPVRRTRPSSLDAPMGPTARARARSVPTTRASATCPTLTVVETLLETLPAAGAGDRSTAVLRGAQPERDRRAHRDLPDARVAPAAAQLRADAQARASRSRTTATEGRARTRSGCGAWPSRTRPGSTTPPTPPDRRGRPPSGAAASASAARRRRRNHSRRRRRRARRRGANGFFDRFGAGRSAGIATAARVIAFSGTSSMSSAATFASSPATSKAVAARSVASSTPGRPLTDVTGTLRDAADVDASTSGTDT